MTATAYHALVHHFTRLGALGDAIGLLDWDSQTMMPPGAGSRRGEQLATLRVLHHRLLTEPQVGAWLAAAADAAHADNPREALNAWQAANLAEMRRLHLHATAVPEPLVDALSRATSHAELIWRDARPNNDFQALAPALAVVVSLTREVAAAKGDAFGIAPYDALIDAYEPDGRMAWIAPLLEDIAATLPGLLEAVRARQAGQPAIPPLRGPFPIERQRQLGLALITRAGFDFNHGRVDVSLHPFCGGATDDVRLTTRYDEQDFTTSLMGMMHETGHALYQQGLSAAWAGLPVGDARGMAMHESQSLLLEMQACRSRAFLTFLAPLLRATFAAEDSPAWSAETLIRRYQRVEPGLIRVDADEVTYPAHIVLRTRLEQAMLAGTLEVADLPAAWAEGMQALLGLTPPDDRTGCLQDIHWPCGSFGYFPTYTLGAIIAAQLFQAAARDEPPILAALGQGEFTPLVGWLRAHIHSQGSRLSTRALVEAATGQPLSVAPYRRHLERRYLEGEG